jgi:hypothetical protein
MVKGTLSGASFIDGHWYGASDAVDSVTGTVTGTYTSHSPGGFTFVGDSSRLAALRQDTNRSALLGGHSGHTLQFGLSGERNARAAIDADGAHLFGDGGDKPFDAQLSRPRVAVAQWQFKLDGKTPSAAVLLPTPGAKVGDVCSVSHDGIGELAIMLSAQVSKPGVVKVLALDAGGGIPVAVTGKVRVVATTAEAL